MKETTCPNCNITENPHLCNNCGTVLCVKHLRLEKDCPYCEDSIKKLTGEEIKVIDILDKVSDKIFSLHDLVGGNPFILAETTEKGKEGNSITISIDGKTRKVGVGFLLTVLCEFYSKDTIIKTLSRIKPYDEIKGITVKRN